jgi:K+-sensing histidine kinase KdpD
MLGHELRNPLGIISNAAHLLRRLSGSDPKLAGLREMIQRQVTHTSRMLDDLLDVSRISRGKMQLLKESLDLRDVVHRTVEDYQSTADQSGQRLNINMTEQPLRVIGDGTRLSQAFGNLVHNACKFSERGGTVHIRLERENDAYAIVKVRDEGMGMEPQVLEWVFEPFSQADRSLDRSRGGLGLGLSLIKGIVELHGGQVSASSQGLGRRSEFVVRLPLDKNPARLVDPPSQQSTTNSSLRILIIEDNPMAADTTRQLLQLMGHTVELAYTGTEGVEAAVRLLPDIVLCDIGLPEADGYSVAQLVRQQVSCKKIHVIGISGYA